MKKLTLILSLLILTLLPVQAVKRIEANPINIAYMLAQDTDSASMAKTCEYYGYTQLPSQDGYTVFTHKNGSIIRYSLKDVSKEQPYPCVEVKSKSTSKDINTILTNLGFQKEGAIYERQSSKYSRSKFTYKQGSQGFMVFHQRRTPQQE